MCIGESDVFLIGERQFGVGCFTYPRHSKIILDCCVPVRPSVGCTFDMVCVVALQTYKRVRQMVRSRELYVECCCRKYRCLCFF